MPRVYYSSYFSEVASTVASVREPDDLMWSVLQDVAKGIDTGVIHSRDVKQKLIDMMNDCCEDAFGERGRYYLALSNPRNPSWFQFLAEFKRKLEVRLADKAAVYEATRTFRREAFRLPDYVLAREASRTTEAARGIKELNRKVKVSSVGGRRNALIELQRILSETSEEVSYRDLPISAKASEYLVLNTLFGRFPDKGDKLLYRKTVLEWHPDKFTHRYGNRIAEADKDDFMAVVTHISKMVNCYFKS